MTAKLIDGKAVAAAMREDLKEEVRRLRNVGVTPGLAVLLVGDDAVLVEKTCHRTVRLS